MKHGSATKQAIFHTIALQFQEPHLLRIVDDECWMAHE